MVDASTAGSGFVLRLKHRFAAPRERVFAIWTTPQALRRWWCPPGWRPSTIRVDLTEGGTFTIAMQRENGTQVITVHGTFLSIVVPSLLVYTWHWDGIFPDMPVTRVTVEFRQVSDGTELELCQDELPIRPCGHHLTAWKDAFGRLSTALTTSLVR